jgi:DNA gyrase subunit A
MNNPTDKDATSLDPAPVNDLASEHAHVEDALSETASTSSSSNKNLTRMATCRNSFLLLYITLFSMVSMTCAFRIPSSQRIHRHVKTKTATVTNNVHIVDTVRLFSTPDPDLEYIDEENNTPLAVSREPFTSEAEIAEQANDMAASSTSIDLQAEVQNSFLQYALSIILGRALPDMRDGLKPVHRRILYSMHQLQLTPNTSHRKCARVVGEVLGKYHPHGDVAVYDALVRMAQHFSTMYPLIDGHGNFGSIDNDPAAAMRYTECRLTKIATETLLGDLQSVDYVANFDGNEQEPTVLPSKLPLLLLNGSSGIAVGMATNIPPHNLREVLTACIKLLETERLSNDKLSDQQLYRIVPGPDFPTGASIMGTATSQKLYATGNGGIVMRAVTHVEQVGKRTAIIVTELPYQVNKSLLLEQMAELVNSKKLEGIADLRDESDRSGIRVVIELKQRDAIPQRVLAHLYQKTKLQTTFSGNFVALMKSSDNNSAALTPQRFTLRQSLDYFLDFRFETIRKKTRQELQKVQARAHIVEGLLAALKKVDQVIDLIRTLPDTNSCREALMDTSDDSDSLNLGLSREQADSVLRLQLGQLTRLNQDKLQGEWDDLQAQGTDLTKLLEQDDAVYRLMIEEFQDMDQQFGHERKTRILNDDGQVNEMDLISNEQSGR